MVRPVGFDNTRRDLAARNNLLQFGAAILGQMRVIPLDHDLLRRGGCLTLWFPPPEGKPFRAAQHTWIAIVGVGNIRGLGFRDQAPRCPRGEEIGSIIRARRSGAAQLSVEDRRECGQDNLRCEDNEDRTYPSVRLQ